MKKAFTLIELLVAVAILAVISSFVVVQMNNSADLAKDAKRKSDVDIIKNALVQYRAENYDVAPIQTSSCEIGSTCSNFDSDIQIFLESLPQDPDGAYYIYNSNEDGSDCSITAILSDGSSYTYDCDAEVAAEGEAVAGDCGISSASELTAETSGLCDAGVPVSFTGDGPWAWTCQGVNGGSDASCVAFMSMSCYVAAGDCEDTVVLKMSDLAGGHAELPDQTNYNYEVCCSGPELSNSCSAAKKDVVLKLSAETNAHVEQKTLSNYAVDSCLATGETHNVVCSYASACSEVGPEYECMGSISDTTNAHMGDCDAFSTKVCCNVY